MIRRLACVLVLAWAVVAPIHGAAAQERITGYDIVETAIELLMFRRSIWAHLTAVEAQIEGAYAAMERIDGMVDRAVISSLRAYLDPGARMLERRSLRGREDGEEEEELS